MNYIWLLPLFCLIFAGCKDDASINDGAQAVSVQKMIDSGVNVSLIEAVHNEVTISDFLIKLNLIDEDDHWEEALGVVKSTGREAGVDFFSILGGGVEFTSKYNPTDDNDMNEIYSEMTLARPITSFTYSVDGRSVSRILFEGKYQQR